MIREPWSWEVYALHKAGLESCTGCGEWYAPPSSGGDGRCRTCVLRDPTCRICRRLHELTLSCFEASREARGGAA